MEATAQLSARPRFLDWYRWLIVLVGAIALTYATAFLPLPKFDWRFLILTATMMLVSSRLSVQIPRVNTNITISDTFVFLVLLLYGGLAGILVAAVEGLFSGLRISKRPLVIAFNSAMMLASTDRKSTRLNSSHDQISYAVFCLKKKKKKAVMCVRDQVFRNHGDVT